MTDIEVMSSLDSGLVTGPLQCGAQLLVGAEAPANESDGASSSEEEEPRDQYYGLTRTVVSNEPFSPLMSTTPPGRIEQLDGIHDSTDSEEPPQSHNGPLSGGKTPSHLPSEIVDFVLKSGEVTGTDHAAQQERVASPTATTAPITQNGNAAVSLSNGTDCVSYQSSQGPPPLRDPPQVQRVCRPLIPITPNGPLCPSDPASMTVSRPASKFLLVNKTTGQIIAVQDDSLDTRMQLKMLQEGANSEPHAVTKPTMFRPNCKVAPKPLNKSQIARLPPTTASVMSSASPAPTQSIGALFLQATPAGSPSITLRVLPMLNVVQGTGQLTLGAPTVMAPTLAGLPQACLLQGMPVNAGLLSVAPSAVQSHVPPQMHAPLKHPSPPKNHPIQPATKRPCPVVNNISPKKKPKLDLSDKLEPYDPFMITQSVAINLSCASETVTTTRYVILCSRCP